MVGPPRARAGARGRRAAARTGGAPRPDASTNETGGTGPGGPTTRVSTPAPEPGGHHRQRRRSAHDARCRQHATPPAPRGSGTSPGSRGSKPTPPIRICAGHQKGDGQRGRHARVRSRLGDDQDQDPSQHDMHDYASVSTYWWPDPGKADAGGQPYIRMDGQINPERDSPAFDFANSRHDVCGDFFGAWLLLERGREVRAAGSQALDHLVLERRHEDEPQSQLLPGDSGLSPGRKEGVLDGMRMADMLDAVGLLHGSAAWTPANEDALKQWFTQMLDWLLTYTNACRRRRRPTITAPGTTCRPRVTRSSSGK